MMKLCPVGGGDPIPLRQASTVIGRKESCDIVLRFPNVSGEHCKLLLINGRWFVKDLDSRNGTKVDGHAVHESRIEPGHKLSIAGHEYELSYVPNSEQGDSLSNKPKGPDAPALWLG